MMQTLPAIGVTQPLLPDLEDYMGHLAGVWERNQLTNHGPLVRQLEAQLEHFLGCPSVQLTTNGTLALQLAIRALNLSGEIITTPFSFVATTASILWERCQPVFVDIEPRTFCLDAELIEAAITPRTQAILATHVYGYPCDVARIEAIAQRHGLKVIYDGAHAFGTRIHGRSVLGYGDVTACSFHATKLFHTGEGGALITPQPALARTIGLLREAGMVAQVPVLPGTNGRLSELHAALGLSLLPRVSAAIAARAALYAHYRAALAHLPLSYPELLPGVEYNYAYFPVIFPDEAVLLRAQAQLSAAGIGTRRYFFPSLNRLPYLTGASCPVSEDVAARVLCLPFFPQLAPEYVPYIAAHLTEALTAGVRDTVACSSDIYA